METIALQSHPAARPDAIQGVEVSIRRDGARLTLSYVVRGDVKRLHRPPHVGFQSGDRLWETTCFEVFVQQDAGGYREFNFSPSCQWAAYAFDGYRANMSPVAGSPVWSLLASPSRLVATVDIGTPAPVRLAVSAVIEETDGTKSWWALAHPSDKPDFHHPDSFVLELP